MDLLFGVLCEVGGVGYADDTFKVWSRTLRGLHRDGFLGGGRGNVTFLVFAQLFIKSARTGCVNCSSKVQAN